MRRCEAAGLQGGADGIVAQSFTDRFVFDHPPFTIYDSLPSGDLRFTIYDLRPEAANEVLRAGGIWAQVPAPDRPARHGREHDDPRDQQTRGADPDSRGKAPHD